MKKIIRLLTVLFLVTANIQFAEAQQTLSGQYTIGLGGDYENFTEAFSALNISGLGGDVAFIVTEGTYSETIDVNLAASTYNIAFKPNLSNTGEVIVQSETSYVLKFSSAANMSFEGIHFKNISVNPQTEAHVVVFAPGTTHTKNISFTGCTFTGYDVATVDEGIDKELIISAYPQAGEFMPDSLLFDNCQFANGERALTFLGKSGILGSNVKIMNSTFTNFFSVALTSEYYDWILLDNNDFIWKQGIGTVNPIQINYGNNVEVIGNKMIGDADSDFTGISVNNSDTILLSKNRIDVNFTIGSAYATGIYLTSDAFVDVNNNYVRLNSGYSNKGIELTEVSDSVSVSNNMITVYSEDQYPMDLLGISISAPMSSVATINLAYNAVSIPKGPGKALYYSDSYMMGNINIFNNIFSNNSDSPVMTLEADVAYFNSDYNIFDTGSGALIENILFKTFFSTLADWQSLKNVDMNSFQVNPQFVDPLGDLHLKTLNPAEGRAIYITEIESDFDGQLRNVETPDIGADEGKFVLLDFIVEAGPNQSACSDVYNLQAKDPAPATGEWSVIKGDAVIQNMASPSSSITNVAPGENVLRWTVTEGTHTAFDEVLIFNQQPIADAGEDVGVYLDDLLGTYPMVTLEAYIDDSAGEPFGYWDVLSSTGNLIMSDSYASSMTVTGLVPGEHTLRWTITSYDFGECTNTDEVTITAGYNFVSDPPTTDEYSWDNPLFWNLGQVPGPHDSVTVFGANVSVKGILAQCNQLVVGSGTQFNIEGNGKANGSLTTQGLFIEQSAVKYKGVKGDANVRVGSGGGLFIEQSAVKNSKASGSGSGIRVGSGGGLFIEQTAVKATGDPEVRISSGGLFIEQTAVKAESDAVVRVGNGGGLFIEQTAVKSSKATGDNPGIYIGNGGGLFIEQTAVKAGKGAQVSLGAGRGIFIEQSAVKAGQQNGLVVRGGGLFIEQSAVKSTSSSKGKITVGNGGGLFIEQTAVKADALVSAPYVEILGGQVVVGSESKSKTQGGKLSFRGLFIEQTAVKGLASDTALIVNPGASVYLDTRYSEGSPKFEVQAGNAVNTKAGSFLFEEGSTETVKLILDGGASLIDQSDSPALWGMYQHNFTAGKYDMMTVPMESTDATQFDLNPALTAWSEESIAWLDASASTFTAGHGMMVKYPDTDLEQGFMGYFNKGSLSVPLTNSSEDLHAGWNLSGNPYPSALDWDILSLDPNINPAVYVYDSDQKAFKLYQQNGIQLNGGSKYIMPGDAFLIKTASDAVNLSFNPDAQVHYMAKPAATVNAVSQLLKLDVSGNGYSDETAVYFVDGATEVWDAQYDVQKKLNFEPEALNLYSKSTSTEYLGAFAINGLEPGTGAYTIPLGFETTQPGTYEITLNTNSLENATVSIQLEDLVSGELHDLKANPTYSFEHTSAVKQERFNLKIGEGVSGYAVTFTVTDGTDPLADATVNIVSDSEIAVTDASGTATVDLQDGTYNFEVILDGYETYTDAFTVSGSALDIPVEMSISVGIDPLTDELSIYPNPSEGLVNIIGKDLINVRVTDVFGKTIKEEIIEKSGRIIIEGPGVYFFKISDGKQIRTEKVIIK